jgi:hypothetical protein
MACILSVGSWQLQSLAQAHRDRKFIARLKFFESKWFTSLGCERSLCMAGTMMKKFSTNRRRNMNCPCGFVGSEVLT